MLWYAAAYATSLAVVSVLLNEDRVVKGVETGIVRQPRTCCSSLIIFLSSSLYFLLEERISSDTSVADVELFRCFVVRQH
jgi:hypothetical protein